MSSFTYRSSWRLSLSLIALVFLASCLGVKKSSPKAPEVQGNWHMAADADEPILGPTDKNAAYYGFLARAKKDEKIVIRGQFPHCRYISYVLYDQDFKAIDALSDINIVPSSGVNPFIPGNDRSLKQLGEYQVTVSMDAPGKSPRQPNTLYAGISNQSTPNKIAVLAYRVYLTDEGYGAKANNPLALCGGVTPPDINLNNKENKPYRQNQTLRKMSLYKIFFAAYKENKPKLKDPKLFFGEPQSPPIWSNNSSREDRRSNSYVPNDDTVYNAAPISNKFGELLVLRFRPPHSQEQSHTGAPFVKDADMRYWSLSPCYLNPDIKRIIVFSETTVADFQFSSMPDGTRQLVIGLGGISRPASVPPEQWLGLKMKEGFLIVRYIMVNPDYAGDFGKLPGGAISLEYDKYTPGGVYCSAEEFAKNPDIGLKRAEILKAKAP